MIDAYIDFFEDFAAMHPLIQHQKVGTSGKSFDVVPQYVVKNEMDKELFKTNINADSDYFFRLIMPNSSMDNDRKKMGMESFLGGFYILKKASFKNDDRDEVYRLAMNETREIALQALEHIVKGSIAGNRLFSRKSDALENLNHKANDRYLEHDITLIGWLYTFDFYTTTQFACSCSK